LRSIDVRRALDAGAAPGLPADIVVSPTAADPTPLIASSQWVVDLRWDRGEPWLMGVRLQPLPAPAATPRVMGRFALELFEGRGLVERVRFDFPLLGTGDPTPLDAKLRTRVGVLFPATNRGTRLDLVDRATGGRWALPWPLGRAGAREGREGRDAGDANDAGVAPSK
jgi:hypothetical protein